jgi:type IV pilus assembly protein PilZ
MVEQRRTSRAPLAVPARVKQKGAAEPIACRARDVSVGGMFLETETPFVFGAEVVINVAIPGVKDELTLPGVVRWTGKDGMGVQFGLLGARETHAITEVVRKATRASIP